ncbi:MAG: anti-sigma factor domain-containing protein [Pyrinomonadaceae bacterium]
MSKRKQVRRWAASGAAAGLMLAASLYSISAAGSRPKASPVLLRAQSERVDIRLRSLTTRATGQLTIEASEGGGRARLTALNLPEPQTVAEAATTYVVWAVSGGRVLRLGELRRDERGNGGLAFERPEGLERYGVIVTAETTPEVERPGDPVLTTRADEAAALYPSKPAPAPSAPATDTATNTPTNRPRTNDPAPAPAPAYRAPTRSAPGDFYAEVDNALAAQGGGRLIELEGDSAAPDARGAARATLNSNRAYVRANFRGMPLPSAVGANVYVLWGVIPDGRIIYMGSLPASEDLNRAEVYVRVPGFDSDDYTLLVTAERSRPAAAPDGRRLLKPRDFASVK